MTLRSPSTAVFSLSRGAERSPFRQVFFRTIAAAAPVFVVHALLLILAGEISWALLPIAVLLLLFTAYTVSAHAAGSRPRAAVVVPAAFAVAYCLVLALGFGREMGFQMLLLVLVPPVMVWRKAGPAGRWGAVATLCLLVLCIELGGGAALVRHPDGTVLNAGLFRAVNLVATFALLAVFIRLFMEMREAVARQSLPAPVARNASGQIERRRLTDAAGRPYLHFIDPDRVFSVAAVKIDRHAAMVEIFGAEVAEDVARQVSALVLGMVRETDLVSRRGGDVLLVFLPETVEEEAHAACERLRQAAAGEPVQAGDIGLRITLTLGVARTASNADVTAAIAEAEAAVEAGQAAGGNRTMLAALL